MARTQERSSRRAWLAVCSGALITGLAGCSSSDNDDTDAGEDDDRSGTDDTTTDQGETTGDGQNGDGQAGDGSSEGDDDDPPQIDPAEIPDDPVPLGESVMLDTLEITVYEAAVGAAANERYTGDPPDEDHVYFIFDYEQYDTAEEIDYSMIFFVGVDEDGNEFHLTDGSGCNGPLHVIPPFGDSPANNPEYSIRNTYCLQVPEASAESLLLRIRYRMEGEEAYFELPEYSP